MTVHDGDYCIRIEVDADGAVALSLYHGSQPLGAPVAECHYGDAPGSSLVVTSFAADVPSPALEWLRERAQRLLPHPGAAPPDLDVDRRPLWYYIGSAIILSGWAVERWRHAAAHGGAWAALLVIAACTALVSAYMQHREEREPTVFHAASPLE